MKVRELVRKFKSERRQDIAAMLAFADQESEVRIETCVESTSKHFDLGLLQFSAVRDFFDANHDPFTRHKSTNRCQASFCA